MEGCARVRTRARARMSPFFPIGLILQMVNKEVYQFIIYCAHLLLVHSFSREEQQMISMIESFIPFDVVFIDFWEP